MTATVTTTVARWQRFAVVEAIQAPLVALAILGAWPWGLWTAALIGSLVCSAGTDSTQGAGARLARWLNRFLVLQAVVWIAAALVLGIPD